MLHIFIFWFEEDVIPLYNDLKDQGTPYRWKNSSSVRKGNQDLKKIVKGILFFFEIFQKNLSFQLGFWYENILFVRCKMAQSLFWFKIN